MDLKIPLAVCVGVDSDIETACATLMSQGMSTDFAEILGGNTAGDTKMHDILDGLKNHMLCRKRNLLWSRGENIMRKVLLVNQSVKRRWHHLNLCSRRTRVFLAGNGRNI